MYKGIYVCIPVRIHMADNGDVMVLQDGRERHRIGRAASHKLHFHSAPMNALFAAARTELTPQPCSGYVPALLSRRMFFVVYRAAFSGSNSPAPCVCDVVSKFRRHI